MNFLTKFWCKVACLCSPYLDTTATLLRRQYRKQ